MEHVTLPDNGAALERGWQALAQGDWNGALHLFSSAVDDQPTAEAYEGLGWAASWSNDIELSFRAWETSHRLFLDRADRRSAARTAMYLSTNHFTRKGDHAVANGWLRRSYRLLDDLELCPEHAMIAAWDAYIAILVEHDADRARSCCARAIDLARSMGVVDVEVLARAIEGYALVVQGDFESGLQLLDEATATAISGEMTDLDSITVTCCFLIYACERVGDYARASQWCLAVMEISERWSYGAMFAFCRAHHAGVLMWRGDWSEAEAQLLEACEELRKSHPAMAFEGVVRLAELRRRQGRREEARALLDDAETDPIQMLAHKPVVIERAWLYLDEGDVDQAIDCADRYLRLIPGQYRIEHVAAYELLARAHIMRQDLAAAEKVVVALERTASGLPNPSVRAGLSATRGVVALANGEYDRARQELEDAIDGFAASGSPFATAQARIDLALVLVKLGRGEAARREAETALIVMHGLGAAFESDRARWLLDSLESNTQASPALPITAREREILRLVSSGMSDREMARELRLSEHTIHRHVSNILLKLDAPSRAAAVAIASKANAI